MQHGRNNLTISFFKQYLTVSNSSKKCKKASFFSGQSYTQNTYHLKIKDYNYSKEIHSIELKCFRKRTLIVKSKYGII